MNRAQKYIAEAAEFYFRHPDAKTARAALLEIWDDISPRLNATDQEQLAANLLIALQNMFCLENELDAFLECEYRKETNNG